MSDLRLFLFGPPRLQRAGKALDLQYRKNLALVAYLAMMGGTHSRETLITLLWPDAEPARARADLRRNLSLLKKALAGNWLVVEGDVIAADSAPDLWLDVAEFHRLLTACTQHGHRQGEVCPLCIPLLEDAVALYHQDFMAGFTLVDSAEFDEWQLFQSENLRYELSSALERLVRALSAAGEYERAIHQAQRWLSLDFLHEPAWRWLIQLHAWCGNRTAALHQYRECERVLKRELGLAPEGETSCLFQAIQKGQPPPSPPSFAKPPPRHNIPIQSKPFLGRADLQTQVEDRIRDPNCRLVTLVGPGGCGKTRLALEVGLRQLDTFEHGVYFIPLAPLQTVETITPTIAREIGISFSSGQDLFHQLLDYLRQKQILLILDNFEHLLEGVGLIGNMLGGAPRLKILVTSRVGLEMQAEQLFSLEGLEYPTIDTSPDAGDYDAVRLFVHHARRLDPGLVLQTESWRYIARICRFVEGLPLAILLAASWVKLLSLAEIAEQIEKGLDFLDADFSDLPKRQRSMRATCDYSWNLLTHGEQHVLQAFSVFRAGFTPQAAEQVVGVNFRHLRGFVNKSLLYRTSTGRYEMHELLRQYTAEKLAEAPEILSQYRERHAAFFAAALNRWSTEIKGPHQKAAYNAVMPELDNLRAAVNWAISNPSIEFFAQIVEGICWFPGFLFSNQEALAICSAAVNVLPKLDAPSPEALALHTRVLARLLAGLSYLAGICGNRSKALDACQEAITLLNSPVLKDQDTRLERATALLFGTLWVLSPREEVLARFKESLALFQEIGERWWAAMTQAYLGKVMADWSSYELGRQYLEASLDTQRSLGDQLAIGYTLRWLSTLKWIHGSLEESEQLANENLKISQEHSTQVSVGIGLSSLGGAIIPQGRFEESHQLLEKSLLILGDLGLSQDVTGAHGSLCLVEVHRGQYQRARYLTQSVLDRQSQHRSQWTVGFYTCVLGMVAQVERNWTESQQLLFEARSVFRLLGVMDSLAWALALSGNTERMLNQPIRACQHLTEALQISFERGFFIAPLHALPAVALALTDQSGSETAVELYTLVSRYGYVINSQWFREMFGQEFERIAASMPTDVVKAARERGQASDMAETIQKLLSVLKMMFPLDKNINTFKPD